MTAPPTNLVVSPKTPEELQKAQEELEKAQKKIDELLAKLQGYSEKLENLNRNLSFGAQIKDKIIKTTVDPFLKLGCRSAELELLQLSLLVNLYLISIKLPTLPPIPDAIKLLLGIKVNIPIELPTIAEFKQYINTKIEEAKRRCQEVIIEKQLAEAAEEESPFTARSKQIQLIKSISSAPKARTVLGKQPGKQSAYVVTEEDLRILDEINNRCCENC